MAQVLERTGYDSTRALRYAMARCGLSSPGRHRRAADYAAARHVVLQFIAPRYALAGREDLPRADGVRNDALLSQSGPHFRDHEVAAATGNAYDRRDRSFDRDDAPRLTYPRARTDGGRSERGALRRPR